MSFTYGLLIFEVLMYQHSYSRSNSNSICESCYYHRSTQVCVNKYLCPEVKVIIFDHSSLVSALVGRNVH